MASRMIVHPTIRNGKVYYDVNVGPGMYMNTRQSYFTCEYKIKASALDPPRPPLSKRWIAMKQKMADLANEGIYLFDLFPKVIADIVIGYMMPWDLKMRAEITEMAKKRDWYYENLLYFHVFNADPDPEYVNWCWLVAVMAEPKSPMPTIAAYNKMKAQKRRQKKRSKGDRYWRA